MFHKSATRLPPSSPRLPGAANAVNAPSPLSSPRCMLKARSRGASPKSSKTSEASNASSVCRAVELSGCRGGSPMRRAWRAPASEEKNSLCDFEIASTKKRRYGSDDGSRKNQIPMKTVRVNNGRVEEFENGSLRRTFGSSIASAATDGQTVAAVTRAGRIETYVNGSMRQTFGSNAVSVQVSGDTVVVQTSQGRTEEYVNGSMRRTY